MRYFFMAEPIRAMEGDLLGVEITTHFASCKMASESIAVWHSNRS